MLGEAFVRFQKGNIPYIKPTWLDEVTTKKQTLRTDAFSCI